MKTSGMLIYVEHTNQIVSHFMLEEFKELPHVIGVVACQDNEHDLRILKSWQDWFTQHKSPWVTTRQHGVFTIWKSVEVER